VFGGYVAWKALSGKKRLGWKHFWPDMKGSKILNPSASPNDYVGNAMEKYYSQISLEER